ncbi:hypothetical protein DM860_001325 [Cuscuta australis]|uniref:Myb-like domain-containing protein n=1 Tax=Cuscuta australis TaxID=267555 RepID=A0A328DTG9_9ASTE|nr:hypothetical protein DM860_001325 [Cuscuta australis]
MFDNVPSDQFRQFIASSRPSPSPLPFPFPFPLHAAAPPPPAFASYDDPYPPHHQTLHHLLLPPPSKRNDDGSAKEFHRTPSTGLASERLTTGHEPACPWSNDEVLALLKIRSSMEIWFPDFTWEHVSRKLAEVGYKRSAEKCKERFEEESRNLSFNKSLRFFTELDDDGDAELYHHQHQDTHHQNPHYINLSHHHHHHHHHHKNLTHDHDDDDDYDHEEDPLIPEQHGKEEDNKNNRSHSRSPEEGKDVVVDHHMSNAIENEEVQFMTRRESTNATTSSNGNTSNNYNDDGHDDDREEEDERTMKKKNMKRKERFEMFKGMCERIVERIMGQQEELHNKIIEDMVKMEEVKMARDDAWKREEMDRINREIEIREKEQVVASDRHAKMIEFLNKLSSSSSSSSSSSTAHSICFIGKFQHDLIDAMANAPNSCEKKGFSSPSPLIPLPCTTVTDHEDDRTMKDSGPAPSSPGRKRSRPSNVMARDGDVGKRWPREEVLALINLRSSVNNNNGGSSDDNNNNNSDLKDGAKGPLWERVSQGMQELGYSRSAKRCKEKWENINKYFRKTKDSKKKRPLDSRTCPYFHQLSTLYCSSGGGGRGGDLSEASPETALDG